MNNKKIQDKEGIFVMIIRIALGLVFIFSASAKGVDPIGTAYRVEDYLDAYGWYWLHDYSLTLSIFLITCEFLIGFALLFKSYSRLAALGVFLIMIIFTIVTYFDARDNLVPDCGCFGDAIKLTNWETFYKNVVLLFMAVVVFSMQKKIAGKKPFWFQSVVVILFGGLFVWFIFYNFNHLPLVDFREWKVGNDMKSENLDQVKTYVVYQNKETGEQKEFESPNYPWNDSVWMSKWEFVDQYVDESALIRKHHLIIQDSLGNDFTKQLIENPGNQLLLISPSIREASDSGMKKAGQLYMQAMEKNVDFALVCATDPFSVKKYVTLYDMYYPVYFADDIELKAMIRSNPGLVYLRDGIIMGKWHYNDFPDSLTGLGIVD